MSVKSTNNNNLRELIEKYLSKWKWFALSIFLCILLGFVHLRYAIETYSISATIKINNNSDNNIVSEIDQVNDYGLFSHESNSVKDEIKVLKSRNLIRKVVNDLNLNIQYFSQGKITATEIYKNPPLSINFFSNDSILKNVDTTFTLHINSKSNYTFKDTSKKLNFGDKLSTSFGDIIITPNYDLNKISIGKDITIKITRVDKVIDRYNSKIEIMPSSKESSIINITLVDSKIDKGIEIVDKLVEEYNKQTIEDKNKVIQATSDFINNRLQVVSSELSQVDLTAETIKKDNRLTDLASQANIYLESERDIEAQQITTATQLQYADYMDNYLKENSNAGDLIPANMSFEDNSINNITQRHNELVLQRNRILKNSSEKNPVVINLDEQINNLKISLNTSLNNIKSSNQIRMEALNREDSRISSKIYSAPKKERQFRNLNRQQNIKESLYLYLLEKREESAITHGVSSPNAIIINSAYSNRKPISPNKTITYLASLFFGFMVPLGFIYIIDLLDNKIHDSNDLKKLTKIPFLGDIPKSKTKNSIIKKVDYSPKAEAFRLIRTNIDFMLSNIPKEEGKVIFVTSTTSKEGKSHTAINLSKSLSFSDKKVLLIETDIRVPKANMYLKINSKVGITNYLVDKKVSLASAITKVDENFDVLTAGTIPPNPAELLMSDKMELLFKTVKKDYDYIVVDTAAVGLVTDTLIISKYADMVVYVVRANYLDKRQITLAETMYEEKRLPKMSLLLNGVKSKKGYGYGYGNSPDNKKKSKWKLA